jgi:hypothetical protein
MNSKLIDAEITLDLKEWYQNDIEICHFPKELFIN